MLPHMMTHESSLMSINALSLKLTDREVLVVFGDEAAAIIYALITELEAKRKALVAFIVECLALIEVESNGDEATSYFWTLWLMLNQGEELQTIDNKLSRLCRQRNILENKPMPKGGVSDEAVQAARNYPIQDIFDIQFKHCGNRLFGLCPFHSEMHGSFCVFIDSNTAHCFGECGKSFDSISAYMELYGTDFKATVNALAGVAI